MFGNRIRLTLATLAFAALLVAGGMWTSRARADRPALPAAIPAIVVDRTVPAATLVPPAPVPAPTPEPAGYQVLSVLPIEGPMRPGDWHWDDSRAPPGPVIITADLTAQTISVFRGGHEIGAAVILYGADDKPTPLGVFPITQKKVHHVSNLYDAKMPYMQRLTNDGVAIHASEVGPNLATHGCIGVPLEFAKRLFGVTELGTKVIVTNGERLSAGGAITAVR